MTYQPDSPASQPTTQELHERIEATRAELGQTVEDLVAKTDVKKRTKERATAAVHDAKDKAATMVHDAQEKTAAVAHGAGEKAAHAADRIEETASDLAHKVREMTPDPVREKVSEAKDHLSDAAAAVADGVRGNTPEPSADNLGATTADAARRRRPQLMVAAAIGAVALVTRQVFRRPR